MYIFLEFINRYWSFGLGVESYDKWGYNLGAAAIIIVFVMCSAIIFITDKIKFSGGNSNNCECYTKIYKSPVAAYVIKTFKMINTLYITV